MISPGATTPARSRPEISASPIWPAPSTAITPAAYPRGQRVAAPGPTGREPGCPQVRQGVSPADLRSGRARPRPRIAGHAEVARSCARADPETSAIRALAWPGDDDGRAARDCTHR